MITALAGGVGAARFLTGLLKITEEKDVSVIVNTGDDLEMFGLHISPDIDIVAYTLAGIVDQEKGWGIKGDTFQTLETLKKFGLETWFALGDRDLATHIFRTDLLKKGFTLSQVTNEVCRALGVNVKILPMTNDKFETRIKIGEGTVHFEEYFVKRASSEKVLGVEFVDTFVIDNMDAAEKGRIESLGVQVKVTNTIMRSLEDKLKLAKVVLEK